MTAYSILKKLVKANQRYLERNPLQPKMETPSNQTQEPGQSEFQNYLLILERTFLPAILFYKDAQK